MKNDTPSDRTQTPSDAAPESGTPGSSGASRLEQAIRSAAGNGALGVFLTSGFPSPETTLPILHAIDEGGADFIELGMPFSDPLAEGTPIQRSSARALAGGITMASTFETARLFRMRSSTPLVLMGYANPVLRHGIGNFFQSARSSGVDGVILPDVPVEESREFTREAERAGIAFIFLVSPNTNDDRMRRISQASTGFLYAVSIAGLTGSALGNREAIQSYLMRTRAKVDHIPVMVGFGIRTAADARRMSEHTDGVIVGSAVSVLVESLWDDASLTEETRLNRVKSFVHELKNG